MIAIARPDGKIVSPKAKTEGSQPLTLRLSYVDPNLAVSIPGAAWTTRRHSGPINVLPYWDVGTVVLRAAQEQNGNAPKSVIFGRVELLRFRFYEQQIWGVRYIPTFIAPCDLCGILHGISWSLNITDDFNVLMPFCDNPKSPTCTRWLRLWPMGSPEAAGQFDVGGFLIS